MQWLAQVGSDSCTAVQPNVCPLSQVKRMLSEHEWIAADQQFFGQPNTSYDFKATDPVDASKRIGKLEEARSKLGKSINKRAMKMLGKAEEQVGLAGALGGGGVLGAVACHVCAV